jgi:FixJ family two-component response regulator
MRNTVAPVCLVEDDASVREAVESLIRSAGLKAIAFESAQEFQPVRARRRAVGNPCSLSGEW